MEQMVALQLYNWLTGDFTQFKHQGRRLGVPGTVRKLQGMYVIPAHHSSRFREALALSTAFYGNITQIINA